MSRRAAQRRNGRKRSVSVEPHREKLNRAGKESSRPLIGAHTRSRPGVSAEVPFSRAIGENKQSSARSEKKELAPQPQGQHSARGVPARRLSRLLTISHTAEYLGVSTRTVRRLLESGALAAHRIGRSVRISETDVLVFLAESRT
jgi:excisionase family DNA binding protein